jgi:CRISPR-associated endonuclease/helicase Cas3
LSELTLGDFGEFFKALWGNDPFPWQTRLARRVCEDGWPRTIDLPTASGKTACVDVAVFCMALHQKGPRRVYFVVDRRVVVDAAYKRMRKIACKLGNAKRGILKVAADRLRAVGQSGNPLDTYELRGGIYRDDSWVRSPLQPTLIASTVDQVGSRLLFRGYGVWDKTWPIHAALTANDSLVLLDEAHISQPFAETVDSIRRYRHWAEEELGLPFDFVKMTATPAESEEPFGLEQEDYEHPVLRKRLYAPKPVRLVPVKARTKDYGKVAEGLLKEAVSLASEPGLRRIAIIVNRVRAARLIRQELKDRGLDAHLVIGRMRPIDRKNLPSGVTAMLSGEPRAAGGEPVFVVATQCLEVGADLDFDGLVTECASVDSLLQRFGRLDRLGDLKEIGVAAQGRVVIATAMAEESYRDPVYGEALTRTWDWLNKARNGLDFGICSATGDQTVRERLTREVSANMRRRPPQEPALLPAHLDLLAQTSPRPALEPDVALFLHGEEKGSPDVQVVWRADLDLVPPAQWAETVSFCPPVSQEVMAVPIWEFRRWVTGGEPPAVSSDLEGGEPQGEEADASVFYPVLRWRGDQSDMIRRAEDIRPGDTFVLAKGSGGWEELGHIPDGAEIDRAEEARLELRRGWVLRLYPKRVEQWPESEAREELVRLVSDPAAESSRLLEALRTYGDQLNGSGPEWLRQMLAGIPNRAEVEAYPSVGGEHVGWIVAARQFEADAGQDESSTSRAVALDRHLADVAHAVSELAKRAIVDESICHSLTQAAQVHDCGKADSRFQALLYGGDPLAAQFAPKLRAKGELGRQSPRARKAQWARSGLPEGFRHELISLLLAAQDPQIGSNDLILHLIASHHGRCRPFAPVVEDNGENLNYNGWRITREDRTEKAAHRLDSGVPDRFWRLTRRYGWWGLAYLEAMLRLGDWQASKKEEGA